MGVPWSLAEGLSEVLLGSSFTSRLPGQTAAQRWPRSWATEGLILQCGGECNQGTYGVLEYAVVRVVPTF